MNAKSTWWSVTAFGSEIALCEGTLPEFVKEIHGGRETCPKTGELHFQGAIRCFQQVRMSCIKSWLKKAHLEPAKSVEALKKYVMKEETSAGEKVIRENPVPHYTAHDICLKLAQTSRQTDLGFWPRAKILLRLTPGLAGQLMNPSLRGFFEKTQEVWLEQAAIVLQQPPPSITCDCGRDECEACYEIEIAATSINGLSSSPCKEDSPQSGPQTPNSPLPPGPGKRCIEQEHPSGSLS